MNSFALLNRPVLCYVSHHVTDVRLFTDAQKQLPFSEVCVFILSVLLKNMVVVLAEQVLKKCHHTLNWLFVIFPHSDD